MPNGRRVLFVHCCMKFDGGPWNLSKLEFLSFVMKISGSEIQIMKVLSVVAF